MNVANTEGLQEFENRKAGYSINKYRIRGPVPDHSKKKVLALGDSFTFGLLLDERDSYVHHLQDKANAEGRDSIQFLNGGIGGSGLADWPGWLEKYGDDIDPDYLLYFLNIEDLERALSKNLYVLRGDSLVKSQRWAPREWIQKIGQQGWYQTLQAHSQAFNLVVKVLWSKVYFTDMTGKFDLQKTKVLIPDAEDFLLSSKYSLQLGEELIGKMQQWCAVNDCELIVTTTGYFSKEAPPEHTYRLYEWLHDSKHDFGFFDITPCVDSLAHHDLESITIPGDTHPDESGARFIANCTWKGLSERL